ncbi:hypothetical protein M2317_002557 [Microbacterium sp. ZKA21]|uniref:hypothetical protein n=1 Tax=Microbacterium sp. ZKA21 TaxID=3381694 RepID=UPI003D1D35A2
MIDVTSVARKHATDIRVFRRKLFSEEADSTAWVSSGDTSKMPELRPLGPLKSVTDRHAELTIIGDIVDRRELDETDAGPGLLMTLSVAAHHRQLHTRLSVNAAEAAAWVVEILSEAWAEHTYAAGALSTTGSRKTVPRLTTQYFYLFLTPDGRPQTRPDTFSVPLRPLGRFD